MRNRTAIITGSSSGIGKAIALRLAQKKVKVILVARREEELAKVSEEIQSFGGEASYIVADLTKSKAVESVLEQARVRYSKVDILVNAAGRLGMGNMDTIRINTWESVLKLNLTVPFEFVHHLLPDMKKRREGWIINISSEASYELIEYSGAYAVSKAALNRYTELLDMECRDYNVHVYALCPGWVRTDLSVDPKEIGIDESYLLKPQDIADVAEYLCDRNFNVRIGPIIPVTPMDSRVSMKKSTEVYYRKVK